LKPVIRISYSLPLRRWLSWPPAFFFYLSACRVAKRAKKYNCGKKLFFPLQQIIPKTQIKEAEHYRKEI
jgi:hypothetical protein